MRTLLAIITSLLLGASAYSGVYQDVYEISMTLKVPRVYNNTGSQGYRKYQRQVIKGYIVLDWSSKTNTVPEIGFTRWTNKHHKVSGMPVTYEVSTYYPDEWSAPLFVWLGHNGTGVFKTPAMSMSLCLNPSYNIGDREAADNTLYIQLSGYGTSKSYTAYRVAKRYRGTVTGTMGCGCSAYSHLSPTRLMNWWGYSGYKGLVTDIAPVTGTFNLKWVKSESRGN